uniref:Taste receptor type 2 member 40 n=1 Tax=Melopsittacus undulatus TaxID=13146 RepID=A0A8C6K0Q5_MELUD
MILIFLSTSRFTLQVTILMYIHSLYFVDVFRLVSVYKAFGAVWMFASHASLWFSSWLYVLYCVKIINLRVAGMKIAQHILLTGIIHISTCFFFIVQVAFSLKHSLVTSSLLITSLWRHTKKMKCYVDTFRNPLTDVHLTAIKSIVSFLILYLCSFIAQILLILSTSQSKDVTKVAISLVVAGAYASIRSIILIVVNSKLKLAVSIFGQHLKKSHQADHSDEKFAFVHYLL